MVLATKFGRKRRFATGLFLTIVTFGIYAVYWNYKAHNELYRQFELAREHRDEGMVWYVLGLVLPPFLLAYLWVFASNVRYLRERVGLRTAMTPGRLVALVGTGVGAFAVGIILLEAAFVTAGPEPTPQEVESILDRAGAPFLALSALAALLLAVAYAGLQRDINDLWDAYDARIGYLNAHPEEIHRGAIAALAPILDAGALVVPLRTETDALRMREPGLRALPELDALIERAGTGDFDARESAERLLADLATALAERAELIRIRDDQMRAYEDASEIEEKIALVELALFGRD